MKTIIGWLKRLTARVTTLEEASTPVVVSGTTTPITITAAQALKGAVVSNLGASGAVEFDLPAAKVGMSITAVVHATQNLGLDPNGTEKIFTPAGVDLTAGVPIVANAQGEFVRLVCLADGVWRAADYAGTWSANGS